MTHISQKLVPKLRFVGFNGKWRSMRLDEAVRINPKAEHLPESFVYIDLDSVKNGKLLRKTRINKKIAPSRAQRLLKKNDIIYQTVRPYQRNNFFFTSDNLDVVASTGYAQIRANGNPSFLYQYLHIDQFVNKVLVRSTGTNYPAINSNDLSKIRVAIPTIAEQQKIAGFLGVLDERVGAMDKKLELLEKYKKSIMQKIFPSTDSAQAPKIRFKDENGKNYPEWEEKTFGEVFERITRKNKENNLNVLTISAQQGLVNQEDFFNKSVAAKDLTGYYLLQKGDFAYNKSYSKGYPMGAIKKLNLYDKGVVSTLYICFNIKPSNSEKFFEQYFSAGLQNREIEKIAQEGARNHGLLNIGVIDFFEGVILNVPNQEEQQKIADFLTSIDNKLNLIKKELDQAKKFKKSLLQQMFV